MENCTPITECLACGGLWLVPTLDLNQQPLANNFRKETSLKEEQKYPLAINRCSDCDHLQLTHAVDPKLIYTHYLYVSGTSGTYLEYMKWYARFVYETLGTYTNKLGPYSVLDIGCNDGSQLDAFKDLLFDTHGVDPAENLYATSSAKHNVVLGFWDNTTAAKLGQEFDIISTQNAFAHNPDPVSYLKLAKTYLKDDGKIFISTSQADMVLNGEFDTIYHEHISYYNAESMRRLAERAGLHLIDVVKTPIHGTSYIFVLSKQPANRYKIENILAMERAVGLQTDYTYKKWADDVNQLLIDLKDQIEEYQGWGYRCVGYGAAAKGMTLLNASGINLECVIDDNPLKQGLYCPGTTIPVVSSDYIRQLSADDKVVFIPLAWNFYSEIKQKIQAIRRNKDDLFLRYFPIIKTE
jgi:2-polyprenyl-3-methyl-5-hydroxy-6-metoxy-1,4-benzoquinol methylase